MHAVPFWFALQSMKIKPWQIQGIRCFCNANGIESAKGSFSQGFLYLGTDALFKKLLQAFVLDVMVTLEVGADLGAVKFEIMNSNLKFENNWISIHDENDNLIESPI